MSSPKACVAQLRSSASRVTRPKERCRSPAAKINDDSFQLSKLPSHSLIPQVMLVADLSKWNSVALLDDDVFLDCCLFSRLMNTSPQLWKYVGVLSVQPSSIPNDSLSCGRGSEKSPG